MSHKDKVQKCCGGLDQWSHKEGCRYFYRNAHDPRTTVTLHYTGVQSKGGLIQLNGPADDFVVQEDGSIRRAAAYLSPEGSYKVVRIRSAKKAERKRMKREKQNARRTGRLRIPGDVTGSVGDGTVGAGEGHGGVDGSPVRPLRPGDSAPGGGELPESDAGVLPETSGVDRG